MPLFCFLSSVSLRAQSSNERIQSIILKNDSTQIDSLSIIPNSEILIAYSNGSVVYYLVKPYEMSYFNAILIWNGAFPDSVVISYKVFPYNLTKEYYNKDPAKYDSAAINLAPYTIQAGTKNPYLDFNGLDYSGSFARGITFGNNQDVVVNSTFNLQMSGKLQNDVEVSASITDNNIPIQPEGNTQQLQEFDKIFIRLSKGGQSLTMGDFEIYRPESYFMNFYKKLQGGSYAGNFDVLNSATLKTSLSLASAKGIYSKQTIPVLEGNQGPYKLKGNNGETFIIILAGTERVYIDGELLVRGAENDYVIDYNAGEITFMPDRLITKDKRVTIEFEYSDKNYFRTLAYTSNQLISADEKLKLSLNIYSEQDSKNQPIDQTLTAEERNILIGAGDSIQDAFTSGVDTIAFDAGRIMYKLVDSLGFDSVFVYSTSPDSAKYVLSFTELGLNRGNYVQSATLANGRVYKWVAPVGGVLQGTAEPVLLLAASKKNQLITFGGDYKLKENQTLSSEIALSNNDINTFSENGNADNDGVAVHSSYLADYKINDSTTITTNINYEFAGMHFSPLERYRPVEFNRDWNILSLEKTNEHYAAAGFIFDSDNKWNLALQSSSFIRENYYQGFKQDLTAKFQTSNWIILAGGSYLSSDADTVGSNFFRPKAELTKIFPALNGWKTGVQYEGEHNQLFKTNDSLITGSFYYDQLKYFIANADTSVNHFNFDIIQRYDLLPLEGVFTNVTKGVTYNASGGLTKHPNNRLTWQATYRTLDIIDTSLTLLEPEKSLLSRIQHGLVIKKGLITSDIFYELGTGQEPKKEYTFVEVEPGLGVYTWNDYNENGIQELDEFEVSVFADEANFIQVFVPTDEYIQSNLSNFNYSIAINPKVVWFNKKGLEGFIGKFAGQSSLQLGKKVIDDKSFDSYNPFAKIEDSLLVSSNVYFLNTIFFNRSSSVFGVDLTYLENFNKQVITVGPESRGKNEYKIAGRYKIITPITINLNYVNGRKYLVSEAFADKNYTLPYYSIEPKINFVKGSVFKFSGSYQFLKSNNTEGGEQLTNHEFTTDIRYNVLSKSTLSSKISYIKINFTGIEDSPVGYAMLEGLQNGNNILWNLNYDKKLSQVLQLTISYEGRKTGDAPVTHVGKLQMRALF